MSQKSRFTTKLLRPLKPGEGPAWTFLVLPQSASDELPRRGRTTVNGTLNGHPFQATLEPDGKKSHWLKVDRELREASGVQVGEAVELELTAVDEEPEPAVPGDLKSALLESEEAKATWDKTSTLARVDWIHWIESAKQTKTRKRRVENACDMLEKGKKRVCCFDTSGFYSKGLCAPEAAE